MCVICYEPVGVRAMTRDKAKAMWAANDDGAGFMTIAHNGDLRIHKPFWMFERFWSAYSRARRILGTSAPFISHFRIATHGGINCSNTHPFLACKGELALVHNGILPLVPPDDGCSDTRWFAQQSLSAWTADDVMSGAGQEAIEKFIGLGNKIVVLRAGTGAVRIFNESQGFWKDDAWYSNLSHERPRSTMFKLWPSGPTPIGPCRISAPYDLDDCDARDFRAIVQAMQREGE